MTTSTMNGQPLTEAESRRLHQLFSQYRDPRTGRSLAEALTHLETATRYAKLSPEERAAKADWLKAQYRKKAEAAAREPQSPLYMRDAAHRTALVRLAAEISESWSADIQTAGVAVTDTL